MKHQQCEWCEETASRKFSAYNNGYFRYSCSKSEHADRVRRLMSNDGVTEWTEKNSEVPFVMDELEENDLPPLFEGGFFYK